MGRRSTSYSGQFAGHLVEMLEAPAWRVLSLSARRVIDRIEIEFAHHGGKENGRLPVTFDDFESYGIHRHSIRPAINEAIALGFIEITRKGRAGNADFRTPNYFRLTFRPAKGYPGDGSHEWRSIRSIDEAESLASAARAKKSKSQWRKLPVASDGNRHRKSTIHSAKTATTELGAVFATTLDISGKLHTVEPVSEARPLQGAEASEPAGDNNEVGFDPDVTQQRLAERIGKHGWSVLTALPEDELSRLTALEANGVLDERTIGQLRTQIDPLIVKTPLPEFLAGGAKGVR